MLTALVRRLARVRRLLVFPGHCAVCGARGRGRTLFVETGPWSRDDLRCVRCLSIPRERCLVAVLEEVHPAWRREVIHESTPGRHGASQALAAAASGYSSSQFLPGVPPGEQRDGVRCEDLADLSFPDGSVDVLITQDVLEHVLEPDRVLQQIRRVLAPGGVHVATFPWHPHLATTRVRARPGARPGEVVHLEPPQYHRSPVGSGESLVTLDWGADLFAQAAAHDLDLHVHKLGQNRRRGVDGEFREVFVFSARQHPEP